MEVSLSYLMVGLVSCVFVAMIFGFAHFRSKNKGVWGMSEGEASVLTIKVCSLLSFLCLLSYLIKGSVLISLDWFSFNSFSGLLSVSLDEYFFFFFFVACFVSWSILEFSLYYMGEDPFFKSFFRLLVVFLLKMLLLTCSSSLFLFFMGWEGVGFLSFLLMGWWSTRVDAQGAALQAVAYNRVGDMGILVFMFLSISSFGSWGLSDFILFKKNLGVAVFLLLGLFGAAGKSAQFGFHPWLPAAMEGPTPVSALLHSSTMVVAGVFLLVRVSSSFPDSPLFSESCLVLGGLTSLFAASVACFQFDFKKMVAYSTTSQLGLMVGSVGLGVPLLAFFHICTHAFFKALLFLCSGSVIHSYSNEQDMRGMGNLTQSAPVSFSCLLISSVSLTGVPFFSGFYSKDSILESLSGSCFNSVGIVLLGLSTLFTAAYSSRLVFFCSGGGRVSPVNPMSEENLHLLNPMIRLLMGVFTFGFLFSYLFSFEVLTPTSFVKMSPLILTLVGGIYGWLYASSVSNHSTFKVSHFVSNHWLYKSVLHYSSSSLVGWGSKHVGMADRTMLPSTPEFVGLLSVLCSQAYTWLFQSYSLKGQVTVLLLFVGVFSLVSIL